MTFKWRIISIIRRGRDFDTVKRNWAGWFIYDLKKLIALTRKMGREKPYLALNDAQRENLAQTMGELIGEVERIKGLCQSSAPKMLKEDQERIRRALKKPIDRPF